MIRVFQRHAWRKNPDWPDGYEPYGAAQKRTIRFVETADEARKICLPHNEKRPKSGAAHYEFGFYEFEEA